MSLPTTTVASPLPEGVISLTYAAGPAPAQVATAFGRALERMGPLLAGPGYLPEGLPELRARIADRYVARGLPTRPDQIVVTTGAVAALNVVLRTVLTTGDRVVCESPTYPGAVDAIQRLGGRGVPWPLTEEGWDPDRLEVVLRQSAPRMAYLMPDYHNPTGALMSGEQRATTARLLRRHGVIPVIDESTAELRLEGPVEVPFAAGAAEAVTIGSASKAYWGGLRIGWIRAPRELVRPLVEQRAILDVASPVFEQLVLSRHPHRSRAAAGRATAAAAGPARPADRRSRRAASRTCGCRRRPADSCSGPSCPPSRPPGWPWPPSVTGC